MNINEPGLNIYLVTVDDYGFDYEHFGTLEDYMHEKLSLSSDRDLIERITSKVVYHNIANRYHTEKNRQTYLLRINIEPTQLEEIGRNCLDELRNLCEKYHISLDISGTSV